MQEGKIQYIDWSQYSAPSLNLIPRKNNNYEYISCGTASLSLITGLSTRFIEKHCKNPKVGWYTKRAIEFLRNRGFTAVELTKNRITCLNYGYSFPITKNHCLMINAKMDKKENSMFLLHKDKIWHHFEPESSNSLFFLNKPTQDVFVIWHPKWNKEVSKKDRNETISWYNRWANDTSISTTDRINLVDEFKKYKQIKNK